MIDQPDRRPGADSIETLDSFPAQPRRATREEQETLDTYPEQPSGGGGRDKQDALLGDAGAREADPATDD